MEVWGTRNWGKTTHPDGRSAAARSGDGVNGMTTPTRWKRLCRRFGRDSNPLRRRTDVVDAWLVPVAIVVFLALCPLALTVTGSMMRTANSRELRAQASWHSVTATLLQPLPGPEVGARGPDNWLTWTPAQWTANGVQRTADVPARSGSTAGSKVIVWLDRAGKVHMPPLTKAQASDRVEVTQVIILAALAVLLAIMALLSHRILDRRRLAGWEQAWLSVGPTWSRRG